MKKSNVKITILYDNTTWNDKLQSDWGFSCLVEAFGTSILFDTGAKGNILLENMNRLDINPDIIDMVFISHDHWDHVDGLADLLSVRPDLKIYCPSACIFDDPSIEVVKIDRQVEIAPNIYSTGELDGIEQALVIKAQDGVIVIAGCSHPGVSAIFEASSKIGIVTNLIGGLHGFSDFSILEPLKKVCPTHCTQHINEIKDLYPEKFIYGGTGRIISLN